MSALRVLVVEDHALVRAGIRSLLEGLGGVDVIGEAGNGREALRVIEKLRPHVVLMDVSMPDLNGLEAVRRAVKQHPGIRILMLSMHADREYVRQALLAGAAGYLLKTADRGELQMALAAVARGDVWLSPGISRAVLGALIQGLRGGAAGGELPEERLTSRQREVLQLIAEGHSTKQIGLRLRISAKTVDVHRAEIMERLDVRTIAGLVHYAIRNGLVETVT